MINVNGKKILFFAPGTVNSYGYEIKKVLESNGAEVRIYEERPSNSTVLKIVFRLFGGYVGWFINIYFNNIIKKELQENFDYIFIIRGEVFSKHIVKKLKDTYKNAKLILYLWESLKNNDKRDIFFLFDKVLSFEKQDADRYKDLMFRPLFYLKEYSLIADETEKYDNDVLFIGTIHSDRYSFIRQLQNCFKEHNLKTYYYMLFKSRILYVKKRLLDNSFKSTRMNDFHYTRLDKKEVLRNVKRSRISLDFQHPDQTGLTIRCIEMLGAKRKLITTNSEIKTYDFYNANNILVIDNKTFSLDKNFVTSSYKNIDKSIYERYSIQSWINDIFSE